MNLQNLVPGIYLVCGAVLFFLGATIFSEDYRGRLNRITSLMLFFAGLGPIFAAFGSILRSTEPQVTSSLFYSNIFYFWELFFPSCSYSPWFSPWKIPLLRDTRRLNF